MQSIPAADGASADQVNLIVSNNGLMLDVWVINCWSSQTQNRFLVTGGTGTMNGLHVCGNEVNNNNNHTGAAISINTPTQFFDVSSNIATHDDGQFFDWLVQIGLGCNNFTVTNNIANTVAAISTISDLSGAVSKAVVNNV